MAPDPFFLVLLLTKMAIAASFVVAASVITERAGPTVGALVSSLPVSAGPAYAFIALDHDAAFVAESALASLALNAATCAYALAYAALAQRRSLSVSLLVALLLWLVAAYGVTRWPWSVGSAVLLNALAFAVCLPLARRFTSVTMPVILRRWYDVPLRALLVACLVGTVVVVSLRLGPQLTGMIASFPIVLTSLPLILQPRIGGHATGAVLANAIAGLVGFSVALSMVHLGAAALGKWTVLIVALLITLAWNLGLWSLWRSGLWERVSLALKA